MIHNTHTYRSLIAGENSTFNHVYVKSTDVMFHCKVIYVTGCDPQTMHCKTLLLKRSKESFT